MNSFLGKFYRHLAIFIWSHCFWVYFWFNSGRRPRTWHCFYPCLLAHQEDGMGQHLKRNLKQRHRQNTRWCQSSRQLGLLTLSLWSVKMSKKGNHRSLKKFLQVFSSSWNTWPAFLLIFFVDFALQFHHFLNRIWSLSQKILSQIRSTKLGRSYSDQVAWILWTASSSVFQKQSFELLKCV